MAMHQGLFCHLHGEDGKHTLCGLACSVIARHPAGSCALPMCKDCLNLKTGEQVGGAIDTVIEKATTPLDDFRPGAFGFKLDPCRRVSPLTTMKAARELERIIRTVADWHPQHRISGDEKGPASRTVFDPPRDQIESVFALGEGRAPIFLCTEALRYTCWRCRGVQFLIDFRRQILQGAGIDP